MSDAAPDPIDTSTWPSLIEGTIGNILASLRMLKEDNDRLAARVQALEDLDSTPNPKETRDHR